MRDSFLRVCSSVSCAGLCGGACLQGLNLLPCYLHLLVLLWQVLPLQTQTQHQPRHPSPCCECYAAGHWILRSLLSEYRLITDNNTPSKQKSTFQRWLQSIKKFPISFMASMLITGPGWSPHILLYIYHVLFPLAFLTKIVHAFLNFPACAVHT